MPLSLSSAGTLPELLVAASAAHGERPALLDRGVAHTYLELLEGAAKIAEGLHSLGMPAGSRVGIFMERGFDAVQAYFGVLAAGHIAVFLNERLRPRQAEHILGDSGARVLIASADLIAQQPHPIRTDAALTDVSTLLGVGSASSPALLSAPSADDVAQLIYTSGSTGLPKGVVFRHRALRAGVESVTSYLQLQPDDRVASLLPLSSVYGLNQLLCCVATGSCLVIDPTPLPAAIVSAAAAREVTVMAAVPPLWLQLLTVPAFREQLPSLRILQNAGGHLPVPAVRGLRAAQPLSSLFLNYGQTETFRGTYLPPEEVDRIPGSIGRPAPGVTISVVAEDGSMCRPGEVGELVHSGPSVADGYWEAPELTRNVFRFLDHGSAESSRRSVYSGDMVRVDEDGFLFFVGRRDQVIKSLGYRISPDEILDVLHASGEITEAVVTASPDDERGSRIVAIVVLRETGALERLKQFARMELPRHMQPAEYLTRSELPRNYGGKHDLAMLAASIQAVG